MASHNQPHSRSNFGPKEQVKFQDALSYIDLVKKETAEQPNVWQEFLGLMQEFRSGKSDTVAVMRKVVTLFNGKKDLLIGINKFMPVGYEIEYHGEDANGISKVVIVTPDGRH